MCFYYAAFLGMAPCTGCFHSVCSLTKKVYLDVERYFLAHMITSDSLLIEKLNRLIDENIDNPDFSIETICQTLGLSRSQLHRVLKEHTQLSVTLYLRQKRVETAKKLLQRTDMRVSEIAYTVGIDSPQNFSKYFTKAFGISPTEFRKQAETNPPIAETERVSVAVLPFVNMSNDPEQEYFSDGITEEIINVLSHIPGLQVAGRTSSFTFKGKNQELRVIGEKLNVTHILEGSVRKAGSQLRITVQLIKVADGYNIWSEKYDRAVADIFEIQDEIALAILTEVKGRFMNDDPAIGLKRYTTNPEAYLLYLNGRFYHNKFAGVDEFNKAISYFQSAIELEPAYAIAYAGIASCYLNMWFYRYLPSAHCLPLMKRATEQALSLDNRIAESYIALARMQMLYEWDFTRAAASFKKALELNWNTAELYGQYGLYWGILGNQTKAEEYAMLALSLEPFSLINNFYAGYIYWLAGNFGKAVAQGKRLIALEPTFWGGYMIVGLNSITGQHYAEAGQALKTALQLNHNGITLSACGVLFGLSGEPEKARDILTQMETLSQTQAIARYDTGIVHACLGDLDTACTCFQIAIDQHEPSMLFFGYIVRDWLPEFRNDPRYEILMEQIPR